jgi:hypothetical protein
MRSDVRKEIKSSLPLFHAVEFGDVMIGICDQSSRERKLFVDE